MVGIRHFNTFLGKRKVGINKDGLQGAGNHAGSRASTRVQR